MNESPSCRRAEAILSAGSPAPDFALRASPFRRNLRFPLLADFEPKGAVARMYGIYREHDGHSERAPFVIDGAGIIRWSHCSPIHINPGAAILNALESIAVPARPKASGRAQRLLATAGEPRP